MLGAIYMKSPDGTKYGGVAVSNIKFTHDYEDDARTLEFSARVENLKSVFGIVPGTEWTADTKDDNCPAPYTVKSAKRDHSGSVVYTARLLPDLDGTAYKNFTQTGQLKSLIQVPTGWTVGGYAPAVCMDKISRMKDGTMLLYFLDQWDSYAGNATWESYFSATKRGFYSTKTDPDDGWSTAYKQYTADYQNITPAQINEKLQEQAVCHLSWDYRKKRVMITDAYRMPEPTGTLIDGANLKECNRAESSEALYNGILAIGKDDLYLTTDEGADASGILWDRTYSTKDRVYVFQNTSAETREALKNSALRELEIISKPDITYRISYDALVPGLTEHFPQAGESVMVYDGQTDTSEPMLVTKSVYYPLEPGKSSIDVAGTRTAWGRFQKAYAKATRNINDTINADGTIKVSRIITALGDSTVQQTIKDIVADNSQLQDVENVLRLSSAGMTKAQRVAQVNSTLDMTDTSGTEDEQITRAYNALGVSSSASTGSEVLDGYEDRITDLETWQSSIGTVDITLTPEETVSRHLYNASTGQEYGDNVNYEYRKYAVTPGETYLITGSAAYSASYYPACAFFKEGQTYRLSVHGTDPNTTYTDLEVTAPADADFMIVQKCVSGVSVTAKTSKELTDAVAEVMQMSDTVNETATDVSKLKAKIFYPRNTDAVIRDALRNPFVLKPLDKGYVSFVFDDLRDQTDSIASIFELYNMPLCLACIPARMGVIGTGLTQARGNFVPGMYMYDVVKQVITNGGEALVHNSTVLNRYNQFDYDTMFSYFFDSRTDLEHWGEPYVGKVRGIIRAGGADMISNSPEIDRWLYNEYDYSDMGYHPEMENYTWERTTINRPLSEIKSLIDDAVTNKTWLRFYGHDYSYGEGETLTGEQDLMDILDYVQSSGITVVTYGYMYDTFGSSALEEKMKALINA